MKENASILPIDEALKRKEDLCKRCFKRWTPTLVYCGNCPNLKFCQEGKALVSAAKKVA